MTKAARFLVVCAAAALAACGGGGDGGGARAVQAAMQGTWVGCDGGGGISFQSTYTIVGDTYTQSVRTYANDTCTGTGINAGSETATFTIGAAVTTTVGGAPVTAHEATIDSASLGVYYDLVYVDTAATPDRLYFGDPIAGHDGSTPALRPTTLDEAFVLTKQ
jgi:hypothetical protein